LCEPVKVILMLTAHGHRIGAFLEKLGGRVADWILIARIAWVIGQRFSESKLLIEVAT
jgi:hypothetical protein